MPEGHLLFDEKGVAVDGVLEFNGATVVLREHGLVAVLVSRAAVAPNALHDDDEAIVANLMAALRTMRFWRMIRWATVAVWLGILGLGIAQVIEGQGWLGMVPPTIILGVYLTAWLRDRRRLRPTPIRQ